MSPSLKYVSSLCVVVLLINSLCCDASLLVGSNGYAMQDKLTVQGVDLVATIVLMNATINAQQTVINSLIAQIAALQSSIGLNFGSVSGLPHSVSAQLSALQISVGLDVSSVTPLPQSQLSQINSLQNSIGLNISSSASLSPSLISQLATLQSQASRNYTAQQDIISNLIAPKFTWSTFSTGTWLRTVSPIILISSGAYVQAGITLTTPSYGSAWLVDGFLSFSVSNGCGAYFAAYIWHGTDGSNSAVLPNSPWQNGVGILAGFAGDFYAFGDPNIQSNTFDYLAFRVEAIVLTANTDVYLVPKVFWNAAAGPSVCNVVSAQGYIWATKVSTYP